METEPPHLGASNDPTARSGEVIRGPDGKVITDEEHQRLHWLAVYCSAPPPGITAPAVEFLAQGHDATHFVGSLFGMAENLDRTLDIVAPDPVERAKLVNYSEIASHYRRLSQEVLLTRVVDLFLTYVARLLALIFITRPETLRSSGHVRVDFVLQYQTMKELIRALADEQVNRLAYKGMRELTAEIERQIGFAFFDDEKDLARAIETIEVRNLVVHNAGVVNPIFRRRLPDYPGEVGKPVALPDAVHAATFLAHSVIGIDRSAVAKYGLPGFTGAERERMCHRIPRVRLEDEDVRDKGL